MGGARLVSPSKGTRLLGHRERRVDDCEVGSAPPCIVVSAGPRAFDQAEVVDLATPRYVLVHMDRPRYVSPLLRSIPIPDATLVAIHLLRSRKPCRLVDVGDGWAWSDWEGVVHDRKKGADRPEYYYRTAVRQRLRIQVPISPLLVIDRGVGWGGGDGAARSARRTWWHRTAPARSPCPWSRAPALARQHVPHAPVRTVYPAAQTGRPGRTMPCTISTAQLTLTACTIASLPPPQRE